jgi:hypothetical protein
MDGYSPQMLPLLWSPIWEATANAEGWTLRVAGGTMVEVDLFPPNSDSERPIYHELIQWIVLNVWLGSPMHKVAWEFEYAANVSIYDEGRVPGDSMHLSVEDDGSVIWVSDIEPYGAWDTGRRTLS